MSIVGGSNEFVDALKLLGNSDEFQRRIEQYREAQAKAEATIALAGKASEILAIREQISKELEDVKSLRASATNEAAAIVADAKKRALLLLPVFYKDPYVSRILIQASIFAILAASWDLLSGFTGQMNFGHALFFGVGAYTAALLNLHLHVPPWGSVPLGALAAVIAGLIIGLPCLRLRGTYLALTTLAFPINLMGIVFTLPGITGGELGVSGISRLSGSRTSDYYITVVLMLGLTTLMWKITDSKTGIIFHAIREDELAVRAAGINTTRYKLLAFCLSGFFAGVSGGLYAHFMRIAGPSTLEVGLSFTVVIWAVFGGIVTIYGPVAAVFILFPLLEFLRFWPEYRTLMFAVVILLILLYMPEGLIPWVRDKIEKQCPRCKLRNVAVRKTCRVCTASLD